MKNVFKAKTALMLVMVAAILSGCGKSKNDGGVVVGGVGTYTPIGGNNGGCYNLQGAANQAVTLFFGGQGQVSPYNGAVQAFVQAASGSMPGANYSRSNQFSGDSLSLYVSGNTAYMTVTLAAGTVAAINMYYGGQLCAVEVNSYSSGSNLTMSAPLYGMNGKMNLSI